MVDLAGRPVLLPPPVRRAAQALSIPLDAAGRHVVERHLATDEPVHLYLFEVENFTFFQRLYGEEVTDCLHELVLAELGTLFPPPTAGICTIEALETGTFLVLVHEPRHHSQTLLDRVATARLQLKSRLKPACIQLTGQMLNILAGCAHLSSPGGQRGLEHALYTALCDARSVARGEVDSSRLSLLQEFRHILHDSRLTMVFQPILDFCSGRVLAWEALARGPEGHFLQSPATLFDFAEEFGQVFALEKVCRETAIRTVGPLESQQKLFLNIHPRTLVDPEFSAGETRRLLEVQGLSPSQVVFEITERHRIRDFTLFHRTLEHYRAQGFAVAVDDVGAGYSGLWSIAELRPDYLKVDMSLIRGIDQNPVKRALLETFVDFAQRIGCRLIAEGIETQSELSCLIGLGVHAGQGYHLARPSFPKPQPRRLLSTTRPQWLASDDVQGLPIRNLAVPAATITPTVTVRAVKQRMEGTEAISAVVVVEDDEPRGLIMSHHLDRALSTHYGMSLYYGRSAVRIMDASPLVVDGAMPVQDVARMAMSREKFKLYDQVVVTQGGKLYGLVSVQTILDTLAALQVEMAKGASPLTGLPGNVAIEQELERRNQRAIAYALIYADLDNFKVYNDAHGFKSGDRILLLLARILTWALRRHGGGGDTFAGHIGGDDFICMCPCDQAERVCRAVVRCFGRLVRRCYCEEEWRRGSVRGKDRNGQQADFPLVSVSLAIVDCHGGDTEGLARRSAEMKKFAKSMPGNSYVRDRREPMGPGAGVRS